MYLISTFMIAYVFPVSGLGFVLSALIYFAGFDLLVIVPLYYFSSKALAKRNGLDADIEFNEQNIIIRHRNKAIVETKEWSWIKKD